MIKIIIGVVLIAVAVIATFLVLDPNIGIQSVGNVTEVANTFSVTVEGEVLKNGKQRKIKVFKYKNKSRSNRKTQGHRQPYTKIKITKIA